MGWKYDVGVRRRAVRMLKAGIGNRAIASKLGVPVTTARMWSRSYGGGGAAAVMNAGGKHRVYSHGLKLAAVKGHLEEGMTLRETMERYGIQSESSIKRWCREYRAGGAEALVNKPRGRHPKKGARSMARNDSTG